MCEPDGKCSEKKLRLPAMFIYSDEYWLWSCLTCHRDDDLLNSFCQPISIQPEQRVEEEGRWDFMLGLPIDETQALITRFLSPEANVWMQCLPEWQLNCTFSLADYSDSSSTRRRRRRRSLWFFSIARSPLISCCHLLHVAHHDELSSNQEKFLLIIKHDRRRRGKYSHTTTDICQLPWITSLTPKLGKHSHCIASYFLREDFHRMHRFICNSVRSRVQVRHCTAFALLCLSSAQLFLAAINIISVCCTPTISCQTGNLVDCSRLQCCFDLRTRLI